MQEKYSQFKKVISICRCHYECIGGKEKSIGTRKQKNYYYMKKDDLQKRM